jgi:hypothetical protein
MRREDLAKKPWPLWGAYGLKVMVGGTLFKKKVNARGSGTAHQLELLVISA